MLDLQAMVDVARRHTLGTDDLDEDGLEVAFEESYLPYFPRNWNGVMVLAESQNLPSAADGYCQHLSSLTEEERLTRLPASDDLIGVAPWDDGSIPLMVKSIWNDLDVLEVAVGNAVPWSCRKVGGGNANPRKVMVPRASEFWNELLPILSSKLHTILVFGKIAEEVLRCSVEKTRWNGLFLPLVLPSPWNMNRLASMFVKEDMLSRFPEVENARQLLKDDFSWCQIAFACHAVSVCGEKAKQYRSASKFQGYIENT